MTFQPKSRKHAIVEVVFGIQLARSINPAEMEALVAAHDRWREDLPKLGRLPVFQIAMGNVPPDSVAPPMPGVTFDRIKTDGNLDWRLRVDSGVMYVNCLTYGGWANVWTEVASYFKAACEVALGQDNAVRGLVLQYLDVFEWEGAPEDYRVDMLLNRESRYIPASMWDRGPLWHLHQGWYRSDNLPAAGKILERIHFDAVLDDKKVPTVKVDAFLNLELTPGAHLADPFGAASGDTNRLFGYLHDLQKDLVRAYITEDMAKRIGLDA